MYPFVGVGRDNIHMTPDEGEDPAGHRAGVLDDEVPPALDVADVVDDQRPTAVGRAQGKKGVEDMARNPVLGWDELRRVVLHVLGLADELPQQGHEGLPLQRPDHVLQRRRGHRRRLRRR